MGGTYTESQKRATKKYLKTLANISIRISKDDYGRYKNAAALSGCKSLRDFILTAMDEKIARDGLQIASTASNQETKTE